jgi:fumarate reductase flavoprotein subunit
MEEHIAKGLGAQTRFGEHLWLDITQLGAEHIQRNLREVNEICQHFLGVDPAKDWIPVRPAQHYTMGGVRTDANGHSPTLKGLFSAGEAACWDLHGFNRLGGNSVAETVVAGMIVGERIADFCDQEELDIPLGLVREAVARERAALDELINGNGGERATELRVAMQTLMTDKVGIFRHGDKLAQAVDELQQLLRRSRQIGAPYKADGANPELVAAYRTQKMLKVALTVAYGALVRTESRGAHYRQDHPRRDDAAWLRRTLATWKSPGDTLPTLAYEPLDVMKMELPPGWRGYGAKDYIDHPDTAARQAEVAALKAAMPEADRHAVQAALLPYEHQLPQRLRGRNERIDTPFGPAAAVGAAA